MKGIDMCTPWQLTDPIRIMAQCGVQKMPWMVCWTGDDASMAALEKALLEHGYEATVNARYPQWMEYRHPTHCHHLSVFQRKVEWANNQRIAQFF